MTRHNTEWTKRTEIENGTGEDETDRPNTGCTIPLTGPHIPRYLKLMVVGNEGLNEQ